MESGVALWPELEQIEQLGGADLVVGILGAEQTDNGDGSVGVVRQALSELTGIARAVVVSDNGAPARPDSGIANGNNQSPAIFTCHLPAPGPADSPQQNTLNACRSIFAIGGRLGVRACAVIASHPQATTHEWISRLVRPVPDLGFDLVAPRYSRHKMEGLLNTSILSPLHRALYGERLQNPMGPDFGLSGKLLQRVVAQNSGNRRDADNSAGSLASIVSTAVCGGLQVCETHLGARTQRATDWTNLSALLAEILGPVFIEMERQAAFWQSVRGSKTVPGLGVPEPAPEDSGAVDAGPMMESFRLGTANLQDVWDRVLPPGTLLELRKLARQSPDQFRVPDELWARIVYDFALGHRQRTISRDHLLRSITPLYLGWIASYALETETAGPREIEARIERLARAYEAGKPYLVSRWRWPDRFNP